MAVTAIRRITKKKLFATASHGADRCFVPSHIAPLVSECARLAGRRELHHQAGETEARKARRRSFQAPVTSP